MQSKKGTSFSSETVLGAILLQHLYKGSALMGTGSVLYPSFMCPTGSLHYPCVTPCVTPTAPSPASTHLVETPLCPQSC